MKQTRSQSKFTLCPKLPDLTHPPFVKMRKVTNITDASNWAIIILNFAVLERNVAIGYTHFDMVLQLYSEQQAKVILWFVRLYGKIIHEL